MNSYLPRPAIDRSSPRQAAKLAIHALSAGAIACLSFTATSRANSPPTDSRWHLLEPGAGPSIQEVVRTRSGSESEVILALTDTGFALTSSDAGDSWRAFETNVRSPTHSLAADPHHEGRLLALSRPGRSLPGNATDTLVESRDGGVTWRNQGRFGVLVDNLAFDQFLPGTVYVSNAQNLLRSTDSGPFKEISSLPDSIEQLVSMDTGRSVLAARTTSSQVFTSIDSGTTWTEVVPGVESIQLSAATDDQTLYAAGASTAVGPARIDVLESRDDGASWSLLLELPGELLADTLTVSLDAKTLAFASRSVEKGFAELHLNRIHLPTLARDEFVLPADVSAPGTLLAAGDGVVLATQPPSRSGSFLRLSAEGLLSRHLTRGFTTPRQRIAAFKDDLRSLTTGPEFSVNAGVTWQASSNWPKANGTVRFLGADESRAWALGPNHLLISEDVGRSWTQVSLPEGDALFFPALAVTSTGQVILANTTGLYTLAMGQQSWAHALTTPQWETPVSLAALDKAGQRLLLLSEFQFPSTGNTGRRFQLSEDGGQTWRELINDFAVNGVLLLAVPGGPVFLQGSSGIFRSDDGLEFDPRPALPAHESGRIYSLDVNPADDSSLAISAERGVFFSLDAGRSWSATLAAPTRLVPALDALGFPATDMDFDRFGRLYAATQFGLMALDPPSTPGCTATQNVACLMDGRFRVDINTVDPTLVSRPGTRLEITSDTTAFSVFDEENLEIVLKVIDGCAINGHFWVFAAGLTDVGVEIVVSDTLGDGIYRLRNPLGRKFLPVQDVKAFGCAPHP